MAHQVSLGLSREEDAACQAERLATGAAPKGFFLLSVPQLSISSSQSRKQWCICLDSLSVALISSLERSPEQTSCFQTAGLALWGPASSPTPPSAHLLFIWCLLERWCGADHRLDRVRWETAAACGRPGAVWGTRVARGGQGRSCLRRGARVGAGAPPAAGERMFHTDSNVSGALALRGACLSFLWQSHGRLSRLAWATRPCRLP